MTRLNYYHYDFKAMGSPCSIQLYARSPKMGKRAARIVMNDVHRLEANYSRYREDSFLSEINRIAAQGGQITVDDETAGLLDYAATCYQQSDGLFDISSGILRRAWDFKSGIVPTQSVIQSLLDRIGWHKLYWQRPVLTFTVPGSAFGCEGYMRLSFATSLENLKQALGRIKNLLK